MSYEINEDSTSLHTTNRSGIVKVNIAMDKSLFASNLTTIGEDALKLGDIDDDNSSSKNINEECTAYNKRD